MNEEQKMENQKKLEAEFNPVIYAYTNIPYFLLEQELDDKFGEEYKREFNEICNLYKIYKIGSYFITEGSNGDYVPSNLKFKKASMIINKEARFLFSNPPSFNLNKEQVDTKYKDENAILQSFLDKVLEKNKFESKILKGLKDCFIGKRIGIVVNFNPKYGITLTFLKSLDFIYEKNDNDEIVKFISFTRINDTENLSAQRWFKKKYTKEENVVYLEERIYSGDGREIEIVTPKQPILLDVIPAVVILNDGLTGDKRGESELGLLVDYEKYYSKFSNADLDALRKSMNPIKYSIDASQDSTSNLSTSPGSFWDLQSDDDKPVERGAKVGTLEAMMNYSHPLKETLSRIENEMYNEVDVPNITSEQLAGVITSGKTIQALYWGLTVRCDEKMLAWSGCLREMAEIIINGGKLYPECIFKYTEEDKLPDIPYEIFVENNYPIPEDIKEEKETDMAEIETGVLSRKSYLKKWRNLTDDEADKEIRQIKFEQDLLENTALNMYDEFNSTPEEDYDEEENNSEKDNVNAE